MNWIGLLLTFVSFMGMEGVAWLAHRYLMHGLLWKLHQDHHQKDPRSHMEKNDYFFVIFAVPGIACFALGTYCPPLHILFFIGLGITIYGAAYFLVHDVFIHQRIKLLRNTDNGYFRAIRRAHKMHHKHLGKEDGECFGMLMVPFKYFTKELGQNKR